MPVDVEGGPKPDMSGSTDGVDIDTENTSGKLHALLLPFISLELRDLTTQPIQCWKTWKNFSTLTRYPSQVRCRLLRMLDFGTLFYTVYFNHSSCQCLPYSTESTIA